jgi:hypothetical protein
LAQNFVYWPEKIGEEKKTLIKRQGEERRKEKGRCEVE